MSFSQKPRFRSLPGGLSQGFTLIEIMIVVAILAVVLATGIPPMAKTIQKQGMNKAINDVLEACKAARKTAVISQSKTALVIHPLEGTIQAASFSGEIPKNVTIMSVGVNFIEFNQSDEASVTFYPNGTSDEFSITIQAENGEVRQIYLDIVTGCPQIRNSDEIISSKL